MSSSESKPPASVGSAQANSSSWSAFLKSIASFNGDLSSLTAPPFILSSTSLTEFSMYWCEHPAIFVAPAKEANPKKRAMLVLKWFITTLKQSYASRSEKYGNEKKPLNPFLGELFLGKWEDAAGTTELISEQVSHHPPATAYSITNLLTGVHLEGYNAQKASFSKTVNIKQIGHAVLTVPNPTAADNPDTYLITLPSLHIEGLIFGSPFVELDGASYITSSTGFTAKLDFSGKGWLSGKKNSFVATLYPTGCESDVLYHASGQWTKPFTINPGAPSKRTGAATPGGPDSESYDPATAPYTALTIAPLDAQHPLESRRAWARVAAAITRGDFDSVSLEKSRIERAQRELRVRERAEGRVWPRRYFTALRTSASSTTTSSSSTPSPSSTDVTTPAPPSGGVSDPILARLGPVVGVPEHGDADKTGGLWRFDHAKAGQVLQEARPSADQIERLAEEVLGLPRGESQVV